METLIIQAIRQYGDTMKRAGLLQAKGLLTDQGSERWKALRESKALFESAERVLSAIEAKIGGSQ